MDAYLPPAMRRHLYELGRSPDGDRPAGTFARQILDRLLIDLSWASSRLEGNTYTRLDTQNLIAFGQLAEGKDQREAQMILNHKGAIEMLVEDAEMVGFNRYTIQNLHALLADDLLPDPDAAGRLRSILVGITGTTYQPTGIPQLIEEDGVIPERRRCHPLHPPTPRTPTAGRWRRLASRPRLRDRCGTAMLELSIGLLLLSSAMTLAFAVHYLSTKTWLPRHGVIAQMPWTDVPPRVRAIILAMMRIIGAGLLTLSVTLAWLALPLSRGETWASWAILSAEAANGLCTVYVTLSLRRIEPTARTPVGPTVVHMLLVGLSVLLANLATR